ncbi:hypothetical protein DEAC_c02320 [Desulfosporosinus acididurans]|uniref:Uncharacterized protein n=1 Tax=Desulfosporosinus acididurans TaxID=476652 RepID=A0A0J1FWN9_9FIRM|nr:hypothetical protein [Desulfosporosinus acididurans]KLU67825.1 hypothetical protein DEAC_c02320 [Desulfosporosinus acididurans]
MSENESIADQYVDYIGKEVYERTEEPISIVEVKVSSDDGETWTRRDIDLGGEIDESGLSEGEIFQLNGEKYKVISGDFGLTIEPLDRKKTSKQ